MSAKAVIRMPGEGKQVSGWPGSRWSFLVTGQDTKHTSMFDWTIPARILDRPPCPSRAGRNVLRAGRRMRMAGRRQTVRATPGTFVFIPPGVPHNIANASDKPARVIMTVSPPGHEHYFEELQAGRQAPAGP